MLQKHLSSRQSLTTFHTFGLSEIQQNELGWFAWQPALELSSWIEHYYLVRPQRLAEGYRLYPDGGSTLTIPLYESSPQTCHFSYSVPGRQGAWRLSKPYLGIRFTPGGFYALFGLSMAEMQEETTNWLSSLPWLTKLCELVAGSESCDSAQLDRFFLQRLRRYAPLTGVVHLWLEAGHKAPHEIQSLLKSRGVGRRTLERQFQVQVGVSPGQIYTWRRLKLARYRLRNYVGQTLADIALSLGYYDQPHFVRQFRQHCGQTPGQYRQRKLSQLYKKD